MNILHLSDLHFGTADDAENWYNLLAEDLYQELNCKQLNVLIISGDIANFAKDDEYGAAKFFLNKLCSEFHIEPNGIVIVPGNHDVDWEIAKKAYEPMRRADYTGPLDSSDVYDTKQGAHIEVCTDAKLYKRRFAKFSSFYRAVKGWRYPQEYGDQYELYPFPDHGLLILGLNSAWQTDHYFPGRANIHNHALNQALFKMREKPEYQTYLKIAVWHHPLESQGDDRIKDHGFAERLALAGFCVGFHGHIHETGAKEFRYEVGIQGRRVEIISAGTFGAPTRELVTGTPWQYNFIKLDGNKLIVETRSRKKINSPWRADAQWYHGGGSDPSPRYEITLPAFSRKTTPPKILRTRAELDDYFKREAYNTEGYRIAVEAHIFDSKGRILLQERGIKARDEIGKLEGIGGELGVETDLHEALNKKVRQELGDNVKVSIDALLEIRPVRFIENEKGPQDWFIVSYLCKLISGEPASPDISVVAALHFFTLAELYEIPDEELSRSTSRARMLYKARFGNRPYYEVLGTPR